LCFSVLIPFPPFSLFSQWRREDTHMNLCAFRSTHSSLIVFACALLASAAISAQDGPLLTITQAVEEALLKNDRMLNQRDAIEQSALGVRLARSEFQPKVTPNILGSFGQTDVNSQNYRVDVAQKLTTGTEMRVGVGTSTSQIPSVPGVV